MRPIISDVHGPTLKTPKFLVDILKQAYSFENCVSDSFHFASVANNLQLENNYVSLDIVLLGNMLYQLVDKIIDTKWNCISLHV